MAKKRPSELGGIILISLIFGLAAAYRWCKENIEIVVLVLVAMLAGTIITILRKRKNRRDWIKNLRKKYNDEEIVRSILSSEFWKGQTKDQLKDSLGSPIGVDLLELKTKTKEIWKYGEQRTARPASNWTRAAVFARKTA